MTNQNAVSPVAVALNGAFDASKNQEAKTAHLIVAMATSETEFSLSDLQKYFGRVANNSGNAALKEMLETTSPRYRQFQEDSKLDLKSAKEADLPKLKNKKLDGQRACKAMEALLRNAIHAAYYLRVTEAEDISVKGTKVQFSLVKLDPVSKQPILNKKGSPLYFEDDLPPSQLISRGNEKLEQAGLKKKPVQNTSTEEQNKTKEIVASLSKDGFAPMCETLYNLVKAKNFECLPESERNAVTKLHELLVFRFFGDEESGEVDAQMLFDAFSNEKKEKKQPLKVVSK